MPQKPQPPFNPAAPVAGVPILNYAGPVVAQRPAFNVRRNVGWGGEHLFRIYLAPGRIAFIRIGGARNQEAVLYTQFGLLGGLIGWWLSKRRKKTEAKKVLDYEEKPLEELLTEHKRNHAIFTQEITDPAIDAAGFWGGGGIRWSFNAAGERKRITCTLATPADVEAAVATLPQVFPTLKVNVEYDARKKRFVKRRA